MVKAEDFDLGNFGKNTPDSSSKFLGPVVGAVVDTQVDSGTGASVLPFSGKRLVFGGGSQIKKSPPSFPDFQENCSFSLALP